MKAETQLKYVMKEFRKGVSHLAVITKKRQVGEDEFEKDIVGIVTMEDVIEQVL